MDRSDVSEAQGIAQAAMAFAQHTTGRLPRSATVILRDDTLIITLRGTFSPAETALARSPDGAAQLRELHRQLFASASESLRREIRRITGVAVCEATAEVETPTGTVVQVFTLEQAVASDAWSGCDPGAPETK